ncbi:spore germination protein [Paenibacillus filicis]|uniref:Spore germination protein n=1 Tax=Paenibacillus filicis TaxID=669464 RepID=A0ABU9DKW0_9BACL
MNDSTKLGWEHQLIGQMEANIDFTVTKTIFLDQPTTLYYISSLVSLSQTLLVEDRLLKEWTQRAEDPDELAMYLLEGKIVLRRADTAEPLILLPVGTAINRQIMPPQNEHPLQISLDSFTEDLHTNIGLIRKKLKRTDMVVESYVTGTTSKRNLTFIYVQGEANPGVVSFIKKKLGQRLSSDIHSVADLLRVLDQPRFSLVPTYVSTEIPDEAAQKMLDGKVILLLDQLPFALVFPAIIRDLWSLRSDMNYPVLFGMFYRFIRICGILFSTVVPSLYVVLNAVNPELLRIQLAIAVAKSRVGVPYPSIVEVCLMFLLLEMVIEATIRLPKNVGPTITMIGGIILGQAIVQAKLVSNLLIIILAASIIANFTITGFLNTIGIRLFKYGALFLSAIFGIFGLEVSIIGFCIYLAGLQSITIPYLSLSVKGPSSHE